MIIPIQLDRLVPCRDSLIKRLLVKVGERQRGVRFGVVRLVRQSLEAGLDGLLEPNGIALVKEIERAVRLAEPRIRRGIANVEFDRSAEQLNGSVDVVLRVAREEIPGAEIEIEGL